jgi:hypothetical protein
MKQIGCKRCGLNHHTMYELPAMGNINRIALCPWCYKQMEIIDYEKR